MCVCVCNFFLFLVLGLKREKSRYFKMNRSTKRFVIFKIIPFVLFPAC